MYCPFGKQILGEGSGLQLTAQIRVAHLQAHPVGLMLQDRALYQNLPGALRHVRQQEVGQMLLLQLAGCQLIDLGHLDRGAVAEDPPSGPGSFTVAKTVALSVVALSKMPGTSVITMVMTAKPMMTAKRIFVTRLFCCRIRIMLDWKPSFRAPLPFGS